MRDYKVWNVLLNPTLLAAVFAMASSQLLKAFQPIFKGKAPDYRKIFEYGGFPSGHTAFICAATAGVGITEGFHKPLFGLAVAVASILIYDIIKLRRTVHHTKSEMERLFDHTGLDKAKSVSQFNAHSPLEVLAGGAWGIACAVVFCGLIPWERLSF